MTSPKELTTATRYRPNAEKTVETQHKVEMFKLIKQPNAWEQHQLQEGTQENYT